MIEYKYPEEKIVTFHYAQQFNDSIVLVILEKGYAENSDDAHHLAKFFWQMVDKTVMDGCCAEKRCGRIYRFGILLRAYYAKFPFVLYSCRIYNRIGRGIRQGTIPSKTPKLGLNFQLGST